MRERHARHLQRDRPAGLLLQDWTQWGWFGLGRIHSSDAPVGDHYGQEEEGEERVEQGTHHVSDGSVNTSSSSSSERRHEEEVCGSEVHTDLLASLMRATAMQILFLRKMSSRMMMTSTMARMITEGGGGGGACHVRFYGNAGN